ncbi:MAG TPA: PLP-dependent aminotransferase family protein, partial [Actinospica sp.]|nr:PLP-dependent aminotransferase family protein [Actinospica sp.]
SPSDRSKPAADADFLQLDLRQARPGGLSGYLAEQLRRAIADGRLPIGGRLPPGRMLAEELRVSRGVVTEAYQRLIEDGQLAGRGRAGTFVVAAPVTVPSAPPRARDEDQDASPAAGGAVPAAPRDTPVAAPLTDFGAAPGPEVFDALRASRAGIDLTPGVPDLAAFPRSGWLRAERRVLDGLSPAEFGYGDPRGAQPFRRAVAHWLARNRGLRVEPDEVIVVTGVAQALGLVADILRDAGLDAIALEDPGSLGVRQHLRHQGLETPPIAVDDAGLRVDELRDSGARAVALTPAHQFPTGVVLHGERRRELVNWANEAGGLILEDDYDAEHRYDRPPVPALHGMLPERVCYAGSVSKILAPALRVGWLLVPPRHREAAVVAKRYADLGNAVLPQLVLAELMESGELERHLRMLRRRHCRRRDAMIAALREHLPAARVHGAAAGLHLMVTFDAAFADTDLAAAALARGVKTQPLSWHRQRPGRPGLVLGYAAATPTDAARGVELLAAAWREVR